MNSQDKERNKYLLKNTAIFAVGNFASKLISFFLIPLYTNCMVASEYGTADLLYTLSGFLVPLFTLNIVEAVLMFSLDKKTSEKKIVRIACTMLIPLIIFGLISIPILKAIDVYQDYAVYFYLYMISSATSQLFLIMLKGQEKLKKYTLGSVLQTVLIMLFNLVFLLWLKMGASGYFLAYILANLVVLIYAFFASGALQYLKDSVFDKKLFRRMAKYSAVLIPTTFMWWIMTFLDRVMIAGMMGMADSGIYAVSYKMPTILSSVSSIFMQAWLFSAVRNNSSKENTRYSNKIFNMLASVLVGVSIVLLIFVKQIFGFYVAPEYFMAWEYVPFLMVGHVFLTLSTFISTSYNVHKDSKGFLFSAMTGAITNLVLNAILIPLIGVYGAAIATTVSYIAVFIYRIIDTRKYIVVSVTPKFALSISLVIVASIAPFLVWPVDIIVGAIALAIFVFFNRKSITAIVSMLRRFVERITKKTCTG